MLNLPSQHRVQAPLIGYHGTKARLQVMAELRFQSQSCANSKGTKFWCVAALMVRLFVSGAIPVATRVQQLSRLHFVSSSDR